MRAEDDSEATARMEAALYSSGRPLSIEEIMSASGTASRTRTLDLLERLIKKTRSAFEAIEIVRLPDGTYVFQLKPEYMQSIKNYAKTPILTKATLKTLSYIAYQQTVSSRDLVEVRGTGVYAHLKELRQLDFVSYQSVGRLKIYTVTEKFQKYFGVSDSGMLKAKLFGKIRKRPANAAQNQNAAEKPHAG